MKTTFAIAVAAALGLPLAAQQRNQQPGEEAFAKLVRQYDKNKDQRIQRAEYPRTDAAFANLDRDRNGVIEAQDFAPATAAERGNRRGQQNPRAMMAPAEKLPRVGDPAPDFELPMLGMKDTAVKLSSFAGKRPVALIFGSYT